MTDSVTVFKNSLQSKIKRLPYLTPEQKIQLINFLARTIDEYAANLEDPFKDLTDELNPLFKTVEKHEKNMSALLDEMRSIITGSTKPMKDTSLYTNVKVGTAHRIVLKELPIGTICTRKIYRTKRQRKCSTCNGTGFVDDATCSDCKGEGMVNPIKAILLEIIG